MIEQKFKLGQKVYFLQTDNMGFSGNKRYSVSSFKIEKVEISERKEELLYHGCSNNYTYSLLEHKLYLDKESVIELAITEYKKRIDEYQILIKELENNCGITLGWNYQENLMNNWISVKDKMPEHEVDILFWANERQEVNCGYYDYNDKMWWSDGNLPWFKGDEITHWMELPKGPINENT